MTTTTAIKNPALIKAKDIDVGRTGGSKDHIWTKGKIAYPRESYKEQPDGSFKLSSKCSETTGMGDIPKPSIDSGKPMVTQIPAGYEFVYPEGIEKGVVIKARNVGKGRANTLMAEFDIDAQGREDFPNAVLGVSINLSSLQGVRGLAKELDKSDGLIPWTDILDDVRRQIIILYRKGDEIQESSLSDDVKPVKYLVEPLIHEYNPTIVFGEKGTTKSYLALLIATAVRLPWHDNPLGLIVPDEPTPVLYLDYERSKQVFDERLGLIREGHNLGYAPIKYLRCYQPLADIADKIEQAKYDLGIKLLIVDSLALAAGGNVNEAETAIRFHSALRRLDISSLILGQTAKDPLNKHRSVFGSAHFEYYASSVWEQKKTQEEGSPELITSLTHRRYNLSQKHNPLGFKFTFIKQPDEKEVKELKATRIDLSKTELSTELPIKNRIYNLLLEEGKMKSGDIAESIDEAKGSVEAKLYQYKNSLFIKVDKEWGVISQGIDS